jgi:hypothetical protein
VFYIFCIIGVDLFAKVAYNGAYNEQDNFRSFGAAFLVNLV